MKCPTLDDLITGAPEATGHAADCADCRRALDSASAVRIAFTGPVTAPEHVVSVTLAAVRRVDEADRSRSAWGVIGTFVLATLTTGIPAVSAIGASATGPAGVLTAAISVLAVATLVVLLEPRFGDG